MSGERSPSGERAPRGARAARAPASSPSSRTRCRSCAPRCAASARRRRRTRELAVVATGLGDQDATYLLRQYLRGRIQAPRVRAARDAHGCHCGLDRAYQLVRGDYLARVDDTFEFQPRLARARRSPRWRQDPTLGCLSLVPPSDYHRGRGRPRTVHVEPIVVDHLDMRCFVAPRDARRAARVRAHGRAAATAAASRTYLRGEGRRLAFLPDHVSPLGTVELARPASTPGASRPSCRRTRAPAAPCSAWSRPTTSATTCC